VRDRYGPKAYVEIFQMADHAPYLRTFADRTGQTDC